MSNMRVKGSNLKCSVPTVHEQSSELLQAKTAAFLNSGGIIEEIPRGISGQVFTPIGKRS